MTQTENYALNKPDASDYFNVSHQNDNMDAIDAALKGKLDRMKDTLSLGTPLPVESGGTGAATAVSARTALGAGVKLWGDGAWSGGTLTLSQLLNYRLFAVTLNNSNASIPCTLNGDKFVGDVAASVISGSISEYIFTASVSVNTLTFGTLCAVSHIAGGSHGTVTNITGGIKAIYGIA